MTAALATIIFLATAWMVVVLLARTVEDKWGAIAAALRGTSPASIELTVQSARARVSQRYPAQRPMVARAQPRLRAAA